MEKDGDPSGGWRFAQCFGDKGEVEDITEGEHLRVQLGIGRRWMQSVSKRRVRRGADWVARQRASDRAEVFQGVSLQSTSDLFWMVTIHPLALLASCNNVGRLNANT